MIQKLLSDIKRKDFTSKANELMNHYCVLKRDSRYDASEQDVDVSTYSRDCVGIGSSMAVGWILLLIR